MKVRVCLYVSYCFVGVLTGGTRNWIRPTATQSESEVELRCVCVHKHVLFINGKAFFQLYSPLQRQREHSYGVRLKAWINCKTRTPFSVLCCGWYFMPPKEGIKHCTNILFFTDRNMRRQICCLLLLFLIHRTQQHTGNIVFEYISVRYARREHILRITA